MKIHFVCVSRLIHLVNCHRNAHEHATFSKSSATIHPTCSYTFAIMCRYDAIVAKTYIVHRGVCHKKRKQVQAWPSSSGEELSLGVLFK